MFKAACHITVPVLLALTSLASPAFALCLEGTNVSGAEYGDKDGLHMKNYIFSDAAVFGYYKGKGMNVIRLPFKWERMQPHLGGPLNPDELTLLKGSVSAATAQGLTVILDPHNFGYFDGKRIGKGVPDNALPEFWRLLATEFANQPGIVFGLMNEPYDISAPDWLKVANRSIAAIRASGAKNLVLVPGTIWSGAATWDHDIPGGANQKVMGGIKDPAAHFAVEVHQYMDGDYSGTHPTCEKAEDAVAGLLKVTAWLKKTGYKGFLGEFGGSSDPQCLAGLQHMVETLRSNSSQWIGYAYWAGGPWWPETEPLNINPANGKDRPQMTVLEGLLRKQPVGSGKECLP